MLSLPGPSAVLSAAGRARSTAGALVALPGRVLTLLDRAEYAVDRVDALLDAVTAVAARADLLVRRADEVSAGAALVVGRADEVAVGAATVVGHADEVARGAALVVGRADDLSAGAAVLVGRAGELAAGATDTERTAAALVAAYEPVLATLQPTLTRLAETVDPREVEALVALVDRLPRMLDLVDTDILPLLGKLNVMAPDLHAVLEAVDDLRAVVAGLPGIGRLMRRGDEEVADPDSRPGEPSADTDNGATRLGR